MALVIRQGVAVHPGERLAGRYRLRSRLAAGDGGELWRAEDVVDGGEVTVGLLLPGQPATGSADLPGHPATLAHGLLPADGAAPHTSFVVMPRGRDEALFAALDAAPPRPSGAAPGTARVITLKSPPPRGDSVLRRAVVGLLLFAAFVVAGGLALWAGQLITPTEPPQTGPPAAAVVSPSLAGPPLLDGREVIGQPAPQVAAELSSRGVVVQAQLEVRTNVPPGRIVGVVQRGNTVVLRVSTSQPGTAAAAVLAHTLAASAVVLPAAPGTTTVPASTTAPPTTTDSPPPPPPTTTEPPPPPPPTTTEPPPPPPTTTEPPPPPPPTTSEPPPPPV